MTGLTDEEWALLEDACEGAGEYMCCVRAPHRTGHTNPFTGEMIEKGELVGGQMLDAVERIVTARLAAYEAPSEPESGLSAARAQLAAARGEAASEALREAAEDLREIREQSVLRDPTKPYDHGYSNGMRLAESRLRERADTYERQGGDDD